MDSNKTKNGACHWKNPKQRTLHSNDKKKKKPAKAQSDRKPIHIIEKLSDFPSILPSFYLPFIPHLHLPHHSLPAMHPHHPHHRRRRLRVPRQHLPPELPLPPSEADSADDAFRPAGRSRRHRRAVR